MLAKAGEEIDRFRAQIQAGRDERLGRRLRLVKHGDRRPDVCDRRRVEIVRDPQHTSLTSDAGHRLVRKVRGRDFLRRAPDGHNIAHLNVCLGKQQPIAPRRRKHYAFWAVVPTHG
eukprot:1381486-Amorphochlora_amoeboformis.AAC.1